jgi:hypothetical protein
VVPIAHRSEPKQSDGDRTDERYHRLNGVGVEDRRETTNCGVDSGDNSEDDSRLLKDMKGNVRL